MTVLQWILGKFFVLLKSPWIFVCGLCFYLLQGVCCPTSFFALLFLTHCKILASFFSKTRCQHKPTTKTVMSDSVEGHMEKSKHCWGKWKFGITFDTRCLMLSALRLSLLSLFSTRFLKVKSKRQQSCSALYKWERIDKKTSYLLDKILL